jgi:hypothetical protein
MKDILEQLTYIGDAFIVLALMVCASYVFMSNLLKDKNS